MDKMSNGTVSGRQGGRDRVLRHYFEPESNDSSSQPKTYSESSSMMTLWFIITVDLTRRPYFMRVLVTTHCVRCSYLQQFIPDPAIVRL